MPLVREYALKSLILIIYVVADTFVAVASVWGISAALSLLN